MIIFPIRNPILPADAWVIKITHNQNLLMMTQVIKFSHDVTQESIISLTVSLAVINVAWY